MPYLIFLPLSAALRLGVAVGRWGDRADISTGLVEKVYALDDISVLDAVQVGSRFLILVLLAHGAAAEY